MATVKNLLAGKSLKSAMNSNTLNWGLGALGGISTYNDARNEGKGVLMSAAEGTFNTALWSMLGWQAAVGLMGGQALWEGGKAIVDQGMKNNSVYQRAGGMAPFGNSTFVDSQQAYTMRQAGMTQMQQNMMSTKKAVMGNEAMYMHR